MKRLSMDTAGATVIAVTLAGLIGYYAYVVVLEGRVSLLLSNVIGETGVASCGNGTIEEGEYCDDGNAYALDGCTRCGIEVGYACAGEPSRCGQLGGFASSGSSSSQSSGSSRSSTGSSLSSAAISSESSASSQAGSAESLSSSSAVLSASSSSSQAGMPAFFASSASIQRNLRRLLHEEPEGAGASSVMSAAASVASVSYAKPFCGDELIINEECDDGNATAGDGCGATCMVESGYICKGTPSDCFIACGDGIIMGSEKCDDGGNNNGDGCSAVCTIESSYACTGAPSNCAKLTYCGDGVKEGAEACDDGNDTAGDGCLACAIE